MTRKFHQPIIQILILCLTLVVTQLRADETSYKTDYKEPKYTWSYKDSGPRKVSEPSAFKNGGKHSQFINKMMLPVLKGDKIFSTYAQKLALPIDRPADKSVHFEFAGNGCSNCGGVRGDAGHDNRITLYDLYLKDDPHNRQIGLLVHEMIHLMQWPYRDQTCPNWMTEGMADYFRYADFDNRSQNWFFAQTWEKLDQLEKNIKKAAQKLARENNEANQTALEDAKNEKIRFENQGFMDDDNDPIHAAGLISLISREYVPDFAVLLHRSIYDRYAEVNAPGSWWDIIYPRRPYTNKDF
ncbi:MAG: basic secretory family protein, partial [Cytophagales bacterium]|nr:basic secretory family protein [Cytophagales bacterium]